MATAEKINGSYVCRALRLTLLATDIVKAVLNGRQPADMTLAKLMRPFAAGWDEQTKAIVVRCTSEKPIHVDRILLK